MSSGGGGGEGGRCACACMRAHSVCALYLSPHLPVDRRADSSLAAFKAFRSLQTVWGARRLTGSQRRAVGRGGGGVRRSWERAAPSMKSLRSWTLCSQREAMEWIRGICSSRKGIRPGKAREGGCLCPTTAASFFVSLLFGVGASHGQSLLFHDWTIFTRRSRAGAGRLILTVSFVGIRRRLTQQESERSPRGQDWAIRALG